MVNIPPTATISHSLVGYMVIHRQKLLLHFFPDFRLCSTIIIGYGNPPHQIKVSTHFYAEFSQHIFIPIRNNPFIGLGSTYHINRYARYLPVLVSNLVEIIFLADSLHFLVRELAFCIIHVAETFLQQLHFFFLLVADRSQFDIRLQKRVLINNQPVIFCFGINKRYLQIGCLLTCINLRCSNQMIDEKASFCIWGDNTEFIHTFFRCALHITLITNPCGTPTFKVDSEREGGAFLSVFQKFKFNGCFLRFFIVYPHYKCRKIQVLARRVFLFKLQIFLEFQYGTGIKRPFHRMFSVFIMCIGDR